MQLFTLLRIRIHEFSFYLNADPDAAFHFKADTDPAFHFNADPDPAFNLNADPNPAPHQADANLRPLAYRHSPFWASTATSPQTMLIHANPDPKPWSLVWENLKNLKDGKPGEQW